MEKNMTCSRSNFMCGWSLPIKKYQKMNSVYCEEIFAEIMSIPSIDVHSLSGLIRVQQMRCWEAIPTADTCQLAIANVAIELRDAGADSERVGELFLAQFNLFTAAVEADDPSQSTCSRTTEILSEILSLPEEFRTPNNYNHNTGSLSRDRSPPTDSSASRVSRMRCWEGAPTADTCQLAVANVALELIHIGADRNRVHDIFSTQFHLHSLANYSSTSSQSHAEAKRPADVTIGQLAQEINGLVNSFTTIIGTIRSLQEENKTFLDHSVQQAREDRKRGDERFDRLILMMANDRARADKDRADDRARAEIDRADDRARADKDRADDRARAEIDRATSDRRFEALLSAFTPHLSPL
jgi:hypothetical protein